MAKKGYSLGSLADYVDTKFNIAGGEITGSMNVQGILNEKGQRVYSPNNKPTPDSIGAIAKGGDVYGITGTKVFDGPIRFQNATGFFEYASGSGSVIVRKQGNSLDWRFGGDAETFKSFTISHYDEQRVSLSRDGAVIATGNITGGSVYAQSAGEPHLRVANTTTGKKMQFVSRDNGSQTFELQGNDGWKYPMTFMDSGDIQTGSSVIVKGSTIKMDVNGRRHITFGDGAGKADGYLYKDVNQPWWLNHGDVSPAWWKFTPQSELIINAKHWGDTHGHGYAEIGSVAPVHLQYDSVGGVSDYYPMIRGRHAIPSKGYTTNFDFGFLRQDPSAVGGWDGAAIIRVSSAESTSHPSATYQFGINGDFYCPRNGNFNDVYIRSDRHLKSNFERIEDALGKVKQLEGLTYDKQHSLEDKTIIGREAGLVAQDVEVVLPEAVKQSPEGFKTISHSAVNALLLNAIKELTEKVEELERKLEERG